MLAESCMILCSCADERPISCSILAIASVFISFMIGLDGPDLSIAISVGEPECGRKTSGQRGSLNGNPFVSNPASNNWQTSSCDIRVMSSSTILPHIHSKPPNALADEERKGLLAGIDASDDIHHDNTPPSPQSWPSRRAAILTVICLVMLLFGGIFALSFFYTTPKPIHPDLDFQGHTLRSNGTHNFKRTLIIVSIDGLR